MASIDLSKEDEGGSDKKKVVTGEVVASLDRANIPDRGAMFGIGAVAKSLGHDLEEVTLSRSTIQRTRRVAREHLATAERDSFCPDNPDGRKAPGLSHRTYLNSGTEDTVPQVPANSRFAPNFDSSRLLIPMSFFCSSLMRFG